MHTVLLRTTVVLAALAAAAGCGVDTKQNGSVKITSISPDTSSITGGVEVQLGGKGFDDGSGPPTVVFGTNEAEVTSYDDNAMAVVLPSGLGCGSVDIQVNNAKGFALDENGFTYTGGSNVLTVASITPTLGDLAGDTEVTIEGSGFTGGVGVTLGGVPLRNIQVLSDTQLTARTPPQIVGGITDLQIRNCADEATLPDAFLFTSGLNGVYVELSLFDYIRPGQFAGAVDFVDPFVAFVEPTTESLLNPLPPNVDACTFNPADPPGVEFTIVNAGPNLSLTTTGQSLDLSLQNDDLYYYPASDPTGNQTAKFVFNASYSLSAPGSASVPAFSAPDVLVAPADFAISAPSFASDTPATITRGAILPWAWNATSPGDHVRLLMTGYSDQDADNDGYADPSNEVLDCLVNDDGAFDVPASSMGNFTTATGQLVISFTRRKDTTFVLPANGSTGVGVAMIRKQGVLDFP